MRMVNKLCLFLLLLACNTLLAQDQGSNNNRFFMQLPVPGHEEDAAERYMKDAITHFDGNRYKKALELLEAAIDTNTHEQLKDILYYYKGIVNVKLQKTTEALNDFNIAIQTNKTKPHYYYQRSEVAYKTGNYQLAEQDYRQYMALTKEIPDFYVKFGVLKQEKGQLRTAVDYYNKAIKIDDQYGLAYYYRGVLMLQVMEPEAGCKDLQTAVDLGVEKAKKALQQSCK